jgi:DNA modification methylase
LDEKAARTGHQTQKPQSLMRELIQLFSDPGELIADPFAGSGSTGVAAIAEGRRFIGWEKDPHWAEVAQARIDGRGVADPKQPTLF